MTHHSKRWGISTTSVIVLTLHNTGQCVFAQMYRRLPMWIMCLTVMWLSMRGRSVGGVGVGLGASELNWFCQNTDLPYVRWYEMRAMEDALATLEPTSVKSMRPTGPLLWTMLSPSVVLMISYTTLQPGRFGHEIQDLKIWVSGSSPMGFHGWSNLNAVALPSLHHSDFHISRPAWWTPGESRRYLPSRRLHFF